MDEYSLEKKNNEVIINEQAEKHVEERYQVSVDAFDQDRLKLNHAPDLANKKERYDDDQHKKVKKDLEEDAKFINKKIETLEELNIQGFEHFNERRQMKEQLFADKIGALDHDYKWYGKDSTHMTAVKESLRAVIEVMNMSVKDGDRLIETTKIRDIVLEKYNAATKACDAYISNARAKHSTGQRRLKMVDEIRSMLQDEILTLKVVIDALANGDVATEKVNKVGDLFWNLKSEPVEKAEWQKEGNSTDVYLVDIKTEAGKKKKQYYVKENLKMISDDLPGYLARRIRQVSTSKDGFDANDEDRQEERLKEGKLSGADYENGLKVLKLLQKKIDNASGKDKIKVRERILQFLGHDFDKFFAEYEIYNADIRKFKADMQSQARKLGELEERKNDNQALIKAISEELKLKEKIAKTKKELTQIEYLKYRVETAKDFAGLDAKKDKDILKALTELCNVDDKNALKTFFTRTLGKEVELYGQQRERGGKTTENEILASNNIATGRIAKHFGFSNEVAGSRLMVMNFKRKGEDKSSDINCTVIDPAEGDEMLELVKRAEKEGLKIHYSPNAVRQLIRLQMFDTVCMQTDRHWRNFKCTHEVKDKKLIIKSIKSYDHDMSFGNTTLQEAFINKDTKKRINKNGMLPSLMAEVRMDSPEYGFLTSKNIVTTGPAFLRFVENPVVFGKKNVDKLSDGARSMFSLFSADNCLGLSSNYLCKYQDVPDTEIFGGKEDYLDRSEEEEDVLNEMKGGNRDKTVPVMCSKLFKAVLGLRKKNGDELEDAPKKDEDGRYKRVDRFNLAKPQKDLADALRVLHKYAGYGNRDYTVFISTKVVDHLDNNSEYVDVNYEGTENVEERHITKETLGKIMQALKCINDTLKDYQISDADFEFMLRSILYYFKLYYGNSKVAMDAYIEAEKKEKGPEAANLTMEVPTMLHMDEEAYNSLKAMAEDKGLLIDLSVKDLNWKQEKIKAFKTRIQHTVEEIDKMKEKAEEYLHRVYEPTDARYNFLLKADAYDKIEDIKDIVWNPSLSYLGVEDPNYLYGDKDFKQVASITEEQEAKAKAETNNLRKGQRQRLGEMQGEYHSIVESGIAK